MVHHTSRSLSFEDGCAWRLGNCTSSTCLCFSYEEVFVPAGWDRSSWEWALTVSPGKMLSLSPSVAINWLAGSQSRETWLRASSPSVWSPLEASKGKILPLGGISSMMLDFLPEKGLSPILCLCPSRPLGLPTDGVPPSWPLSAVPTLQWKCPFWASQRMILAVPP